MGTGKCLGVCGNANSGPRIYLPKSHIASGVSRQRAIALLSNGDRFSHRMEHPDSTVSILRNGFGSNRVVRESV